MGGRRATPATDPTPLAFLDRRGSDRIAAHRGPRWAAIPFGPLRAGLGGPTLAFIRGELKRQGKRRNGRWERGAINKSVDSDPVTTARMTEVGLILDVADRADGLPFPTAWRRL